VQHAWCCPYSSKPHPSANVACCCACLQVRVRLDERRIGEILAGIDSASMGAAFVSTAGRLLGHLGDVMTLGFTPAALAGGGCCLACCFACTGIADAPAAGRSGYLWARCRAAAVC